MGATIERMSYAEMSDEQLAQEVSRVIGLSLDSARRAVESSDAALGRSWAVSVLEREAEAHRANDRLTGHREALRLAARS